MTEDDLQRACRLGDTSDLEQILNKNPALLNQLDSNLGWAPLYRTVICGHSEATAYLLSIGADPNIRNKLGETPLHQAVDNNHLEITQLLLDFQADPNMQQNDGDTPLHAAVYKHSAEMVKLLLAYSADPNIQNRVLRKTPLHYAVENSLNEIIELLTDHSACEDVPAYGKRGPFEHAQSLNEVKYMTEAEESLANCIISEEQSNEAPPIMKMSEKPIFNKAESMIEPELERSLITSLNKSFANTPRCLYQWLSNNRLSCLFDILHENGFDDLHSLLSQMSSNSPITDEMLQSIGVQKPGHRARLLALLDREVNKKQDSPKNYSCCDKHVGTSAVLIKPSLEEWLSSINLSYLASNLARAGYDDLEHLFVLMESKYPITDKVLEKDAKIIKLGHRQRILSKLHEEVIHKSKYMNADSAACTSCLLV